MRPWLAQEGLGVAPADPPRAPSLGFSLAHHLPEGARGSVASEESTRQVMVVGPRNGMALFGRAVGSVLFRDMDDGSGSNLYFRIRKLG